jgi:MoxR-like ATPase
MIAARQRIRASGQRPLTRLICDRVRLAAMIGGEEQRETDTRALVLERARVEHEIDTNENSGLRRLRDIFRLNGAESDLLSVCLALAIDPSLAAAFREIAESDGRGYVTAPLVSRLFGHSPSLVWNPAGSLALWSLVAANQVGPGEPNALTIDPVVPAWLEGALWIDRDLAGLVRNAEGNLALSNWPIETLAVQVRRARSLGKPIRIAISGAPGSGSTARATAVAKAAALPAFIVDTSDIAEADWTDRYVRLQRLSAVSGSALIWTGTQVGRPWPGLVARAPVHFVTIDPQVTLRPLGGTLNVRVEMPIPTIDERRQLWLDLVPVAATWASPDLEALTLHYRLGAEDILAISSEAPTTAAAAAAMARTRHRGTCDDVVSELSCPFTWDDLVLPAAQKSSLSEFAFEAVERERLWESPAAGRLFPRETGLVALFSGPSGTGKTMAAQVIAADLALDLLRVDLAAVVSKYIGDTAKNLNKVFAVARQRQAILLFDEADAHFARRTEVKDAHDRYANADTNHLLQLIESHRGIVILATNRRSDMDSAFIRRLRYVIEFPRPQPSERLELWRHAICEIASGQWPELARRIAELAEAIDLSGAQIKQAALSALFAARRDRGQFSFAHILHGIDRELVKEGRPLTLRDKERWLRNA